MRQLLASFAFNLSIRIYSQEQSPPGPDARAHTGVHGAGDDAPAYTDDLCLLTTYEHGFVEPPPGRGGSLVDEDDGYNGDDALERWRVAAGLVRAGGAGARARARARAAGAEVAAAAGVGAALYAVGPRRPRCPAEMKRPAKMRKLTECDDTQYLAATAAAATAAAAAAAEEEAVAATGAGAGGSKGVTNLPDGGGGGGAAGGEEGRVAAGASWKGKELAIHQDNDIGRGGEGEGGRGGGGGSAAGAGAVAAADGSRRSFMGGRIGAVVQQGLWLPLEVFRCGGGKGWGLRCAVAINAGAFGGTADRFPVCTSPHTLA